MSPPSNACIGAKPMQETCMASHPLLWSTSIIMCMCNFWFYTIIYIYSQWNVFWLAILSAANEQCIQRLRVTERRPFYLTKKGLWIPRREFIVCASLRNSISLRFSVVPFGIALHFSSCHTSDCCFDIAIVYGYHNSRYLCLQTFHVRKFKFV